jgi:hypothetical protein
MTDQTYTVITTSTSSAEDNITCTPDQIESRLSNCIPCSNFFIDTDSHSKCKETGCNISFMTTLNYKSCPKGNW